MSRVTVTGEGQVTLPAEVRDRTGLAAGDQLDIDIGSDGTIRLRKVRRLSDIAGMLGRPPKNADAKTVESPFRSFEV